jgi:hypothetical protein
MMKTKNFLLLLLCLGNNAHAALVDRGGGLLYDDVLNITWLQDANYAKTSGFDATGNMTWNQASNWVANLVYHDSVRDVDYSDWRLPFATPINGIAYQPDYSYDGSTDYGNHIINTHSEMSWMYYVNLGLKSMWDSNGVYQPYDHGIFGDGTHIYGSTGAPTTFGANGERRRYFELSGQYEVVNTGGTAPQNNVGLVINLQDTLYWTGSELEGGPLPIKWDFNMVNGSQRHHSAINQWMVWAVRDGDVATVPLPSAGLLLGSALAGFASLRRRQPWSLVRLA